MNTLIKVKNENSRLVEENEILAGQLETLNIDYENATNQKAIMDANYADIEETLSKLNFPVDIVFSGPRLSYIRRYLRVKIILKWFSKIIIFLERVIFARITLIYSLESELILENISV